MSETNLWTTMQRNMKGRWQIPHRHEDLINKGIADVSFCKDGQRGWMELKHIPMWPKRDTTIVRCEHFTDDQRDELREQDMAAGMTFLFAQIDRDYLMFTGTWAANNFGRVVRADLFENALGHWHHRCAWHEVELILAEAAHDLPW